ncbi:succinyl-diaminopimelate desuccinylase [Acidithrix ferrooxidans]|uniref:Succinyl-diaminopimelate desuccinylase n=1 Tax=Acidithrix ferrooxidans TaxID=1280514 RepID=A0A0D8HME1_9ACTN|nr:succinyl-diaminopimelate desuccinylase [Acidithrix ferrooxidans]KJF19014.1 succinyl-diaminopimelate desuccinylase [Acidithrix ferrooxidans]
MESRDLLDLAYELVCIDSLSRNEREIADFIEGRLRVSDFYDLVRIGNNIVATPSGYMDDQGIIIAGHIDTVPPSPNLKPKIVADSLCGLGAVDMKGGIAVMMKLLLSQIGGKYVRYVFYASEEISRSFSGLLEIEAFNRGLLRASGAVLMEPTGGYIEAGCQGTAKFKVTIAGERAHSARPWMGVNAIHRSYALLGALDSNVSKAVSIDSCDFKESLLATSINGGIAGNVVPDRVEIGVNYRFAPAGNDSQSLLEIEEFLTSKISSDYGDKVELVDWAPSAPPNLGNSLISSLSDVAGGKVRAKLGWTDVAFFWERQVSACNFGPGDPTLAHTDQEIVSIQELDFCYLTLSQVIGSQVIGLRSEK